LGLRVRTVYVRLATDLQPAEFADHAYVKWHRSYSDVASETRLARGRVACDYPNMDTCHAMPESAFQARRYFVLAMMLVVETDLSDRFHQEAGILQAICKRSSN
jgi:hypothetical protein